MPCIAYVELTRSRRADGTASERRRVFRAGARDRGARWTGASGRLGATSANGSHTSDTAAAFALSERERRVEPRAASEREPHAEPAICRRTLSRRDPFGGPVNAPTLAMLLARPTTIGLSQRGPSTACTCEADSKVTDRGERSRRADSLRRVYGSREADRLKGSPRERDRRARLAAHSAALTETRGSGVDREQPLSAPLHREAGNRAERIRAPSSMCAIRDVRLTGGVAYACTSRPVELLLGASGGGLSGRFERERDFPARERDAHERHRWCDSSASEGEPHAEPRDARVHDLEHLPKPVGPVRRASYCWPSTVPSSAR